VNAADLTTAARGMLHRENDALVGVWPRAAALLSRQALEYVLADFWAAKGLGIGHASTHAQLLCLDTYLKDEDVSGAARHAWWALSGACHHHPYELAPTREELTRWLDAVDEVAAAIDVEIRRPAAAR
jgi:hypothetical protein